MHKKSVHEVVGEAENGKVAIERNKQLAPDIVTMGYHNAELDGLHALREILAINPSAM